MAVIGGGAVSSGRGTLYTQNGLQSTQGVDVYVQNAAVVGSRDFKDDASTSSHAVSTHASLRCTNVRTTQHGLCSQRTAYPERRGCTCAARIKWA